MHSVAKRSALVLMLIAACQSAKDATDTTSRDSVAPQLPAPTTSAPVDRPPIAALTFDTTRWTADVEAQAIAASGGRVSRNGPLLELQLANGRSVTLRNDGSDVDGRRYVYLGAVGAPGYDVIGVAPVQIPPVQLLLVGRQTGDTTFLRGIPIVSPDRKRFLIIPGESDAEHSIEIWSLASGVPRFEWGTGNEMPPIDGAWADDSTVAYRVVSARPRARADTIEMQLPFRDGGWQIVRRLTP